MNYWERLVERGDFYPIDILISECDICGQERLVEVLSDGKKFIKLCKKCVAKDAQEELYGILRKSTSLPESKT